MKNEQGLLQGPPPIDPTAQVVGITVHLTFAKRAYALARWYRQRGAKVILGGLHMFSNHAQGAVHADAAAIGDGVKLWPVILKDVESNRLKNIYRADYTGPCWNDPPVNRDILPQEDFLTTASIIASRGCHNRCQFCYLSTKGLKMPYRSRKIDSVVDEIQTLDQPYVVFIDNNLGADKAFLYELCKSLAPLNIIWSAAQRFPDASLFYGLVSV